jgi:hypothetical protein
MSAVASLDARRNDLTHDLVLPSLLFAALGAMTWAVRGTAGASAMNAHIAPGLTWGAAWWYLARDPAGRQSRRYASGWVMFALTVGFALAGNRGWTQWPQFFEGHLSTNYARGEWVPISRSFGFLWLFIAGAAWAGLPACLLAWCGEGRPLRAWEWTLRIACGLGGAYLAWRLYARFPEFFLPRYGSIEAKYHDFHANPGLARLYRDNGAAVRHAGYCLGFLFFEAARRDWKNVLLVSTVGVLNGLGWALCQNWKWAAQVWPDASFNFWRCWECCGGISIGIAFGVAYFLVNRKEAREAQVARELRLGRTTLSREWLLAAGLLLLIGWTQFWPAARDLRAAAAQGTSNAADAWGVICCGAAVICLLAALAHRFLMGNVAEEDRRRLWRHQSLEHWVGIGLMLVLGWFIRNEVTAGFGDGVRQPAWTGLLGPGNIYFSIVVAYCFVRLPGGAWRPAPRAASAIGDFNPEAAADPWGLDWLTTYLCLAVILIAAIGIQLVTWWKAPVWFGVVGAAYGMGYYLLTSRQANGDFACDPNLERWGAFVGLLYGLGLSLRKTLKGAANVYLGDEKYWDRVCWNWVALVMLVCLLAGLVWLLHKRLPKNFRGDRFPHAAAILWLVLLTQNVMAQVVTGPVFGPRASWNNFMFNLLYVLLFALTAVVVYHFQFMKSKTTAPVTNSCW